MQIHYVNELVQIKSTKLEPPEYRGVKGKVIRFTNHGYAVVSTTDNREVILHPKSLRILSR